MPIWTEGQIMSAFALIGALERDAQAAHKLLDKHNVPPSESGGVTPRLAALLARHEIEVTALKGTVAVLRRVAALSPDERARLALGEVVEIKQL